MIPFGKKLMDLQKDSMNSERVQTEEELSRSIAEKWDIIVSAFPNFEQWKKANTDSPRFRVLVAEMCSDTVSASKGSKSDQELEECWSARVDAANRRREKTPMIILPEAILGFLTFAILLREGAQSTKECSANTDSYQCSNYNLPGSICVQSCVNTIDEEMKLQTLRVINHARSPIMYCAQSGDWIGGPVSCLELRQTQNSIPPLGPPEFFTR